MPTIKLRGEGWLALPAEFRRKLKLKSGDELEAEIVDDAIRLRVVGRVQSSLWPQETEMMVEARIPAPAIVVPDPEPPSPQPKHRSRPPKVRQEI